MARRQGLMALFLMHMLSPKQHHGLVPSSEILQDRGIVEMHQGSVVQTLGSESHEQHYVDFNPQRAETSKRQIHALGPLFLLSFCMSPGFAPCV